MSVDPNDVDFIENIKKLVGVDAKGVEDLLPKLDPTTLIDIASAVTRSNKKEVLRLIKIGREEMMHEDRLIDKKPNDFTRKKKTINNPEKTTLCDSDIIFNVGDAVEVDGQQGTVKLPKAPNNTVGVMIQGKLEMVHRSDVKREMTKDDIKEAVIGLAGIPGLRRMQELAGISSSVPEVPSVTAPQMSPVEINVEDETHDGEENIASTDDCGSCALSLLDQLEQMLPDLRLADIKAVRQKMTDITMQMNESAGFSIKKSISETQNVTRKLKR